MIAYAGIDGTGEWSDESYAKTFEESHVHTLYKKWPYRDLCFYNRGPSAAGLETGMLAQWAYNFVVEKVKAGKAKGVVLSGYSRGAAAVIETAKWLRDRFLGFGEIEVDCLVLYDAVDRSSEVGGFIYDTPICENVRECYHAMRDPLTASRESFSNCGREVQNRSKTIYLEKTFFCTHGGLGGTPWPGPEAEYIDEGWPDNKTEVTHRADRLGSKQVWDWTHAHLQNCLTRVTRRINDEMRSAAAAKR